MDRAPSRIETLPPTGVRPPGPLLELLALFGAPPLLLTGARALDLPVPVIPLILLATAGFGVFLARDRSFERRVLTRFASPAEWARVLLIFAVLGGLLVAYVLHFEPENWLGLPRRSPGLWATVMVFYPLLSVFPQEVVFRGFFFHRYARLLSTPWLLVGSSALAFGVAHLFYGHPISVALSTIGGCLFGVTYARTRSLLLVSFEHALYGCLIFTIGLGHYFYTPL